MRRILDLGRIRSVACDDLILVRLLVPSLVAAYLALYITFCLWSHSEDLQGERSPSAMVLAEFTGELALLLAALSYWFQPLRELPGALLVALYVAGCASFVVHALLSGRKQVADQSLSTQGKLFVAVSGTALGIVIAAPLLYWGWQSSLRSVYAEA